MLNYSIRRLLGMIPMLLLISIVVFTLAMLMPGIPSVEKLIQQIPVLSILKQMREKLGYNDPIYVQYFRGFQILFKEILENQTRYKMAVTDVIGERLPNTIFLGFTSLVITYILHLLWDPMQGENHTQSVII